MNSGYKQNINCNFYAVLQQQIFCKGKYVKQYLKCFSKSPFNQGCILNKVKIKYLIIDQKNFH